MADLSIKQMECFSLEELVTIAWGACSTVGSLETLATELQFLLCRCISKGLHHYHKDENRMLSVARACPVFMGLEGIMRRPRTYLLWLNDRQLINLILILVIEHWDTQMSLHPQTLSLNPRLEPLNP